MADAQKKNYLPWHDGFSADIQIELGEEADHLDFISELRLGTEPPRTDMLILKKQSGRPIHKNLGRIFKTYNILEYKSPDDTLSIDAFYKAYAYLYFYKAYTGGEDAIPITEMTLSLICSHYPAKLFQHLLSQCHYKIEEVYPGIYYIIGNVVAVQIIVTRRLSPTENFWLSSLDNCITDEAKIKQLLTAYSRHTNDMLYRTVMNIIVHANWQSFKEEKRDMCEALKELMAEEFEAERKLAHDSGKKEGISLGREEGISLGRKEGISLGREEGISLGREEGISLGREEGISLGREEGISLGRKEGISLGREEGISLGRKEGISLGRNEGKLEQARATACYLSNLKMDLSEIASAVNVSTELVQQWISGLPVQ